MKTFNKVLVIAALSTSVLASGAYAITQSVTANVTFITPLSISSVVNASFGKLSAGVAATTYKIDTAGAVTTTTGPGVKEFGTSNAASFTITGSAFQTINISTGSYTASAGVTPSAAMCKYGAAAEVSCDAAALDTAAAPGNAGTALLMGLTIAAAATIADGTAATPSFVVTVVYN